MTLTRRRMIASCAALPLASALPGTGVAERSIGTGRLTTVSDGFLTLPGDFIFGPMPQDALPGVLDEFGQSATSLTPECNLALYRDGTNIVLFDVGSGPDFMPSAGLIEESLSAVDLSPGDITHVLFTHAHPDHIWGLLDDFDDPLFAEATYFMGRDEWDYWWNPDTVDTIGEARAAFAVGAKRRLEVIEDNITLFENGEEVLPGIAAVASYGHTPGHMSFEIRQGGDAALIVGDAVGNHHVGFARPDWPSGSDQDAETAARTRRMLLERCVADDMPLVGFHLPQGGMGRVARSGQNFRFVAEAF